MMLFLNCALTEFLPRYTLPLWKVLFVAILLQVSTLAEATKRMQATVTP